MLIAFYLFIFFLGSAIGSFLGVIVDRLISKEPIWKGRSHCDHCRHKLSATDLVPIFSFLALQGKCRYCKKRLSWQFLGIEVLTGALFVITTYVLFQSNWYMLTNLQYVFVEMFYLALVSSLVAIVFADLRFGIIPFKIVGFALGISLLWYLILPSFYFTPDELRALGIQSDVLNGLIGGLGASLFFFFIFLLTKGRGLGFGDVVYAFLMGFILGSPKIILALYLAFVSGAIISLILILMHKKKFKGGTIPFGPFLVLGTIVSLLWGNSIINYVMTVFI